MNEKDMTDEQVVEHCRERMQALIDATDWNAGTLGEMLDSTGKPREARQVVAADMKLLGTFHIRLPPAVLARFPSATHGAITLHFVHRHTSGEVYVLHLPKRLELRRRGAVTIEAFIDQPAN